MKRWVLLVAWCVLAPLGVSAQTAVSGNLKDAGVVNVTAQNTYVRFTLTNFGGNIPRVTTSNVIVVPYKDFKPDANGNITGFVEDNLAITPAGTFYQVCIFYQGVQFRCGTYLITGPSFNLNSATPLSTIPTAGPNQIVTQLFSCPQSTASTTWTCTHNFNDTNVQIQAFDLSGKVIYPDTVTGTNSNAVTITFVTAQAGLAVIFHAGSIAIATNQPNAVLQNPTGAQVIGGPTLTINPPTTFGSSVTDTIRDGIYIVGNPTYPCTSTGINQAIADSIAASILLGNAHGGAGVDARLCQGNITMSSQINVGNASQQSVTLWLPNGATWTFSITDGTSCGILQYAGTTIIGPGLGGGNLTGRMALRRGVGSNLFATYCTRYAQTNDFADAGYYYATGFMTYQPDSVASASGYGAIFAGTFDRSDWKSIEVSESTVGVNGAHVYGICCETSLDIVANVSGGIPLVVGWHSAAAIPGFSNTQDLSITGTFGHSLAGQPEILLDQGQAAGIIFNVAFPRIYGEGTLPNGSTSPMIDIGQQVEGVSIGGGRFVSEVAAGSSQPCIQVEANASRGDLRVENFWCSGFQNSTAVINNLKNGTFDNGTVPFTGNNYFLGHTDGGLRIAASSTSGIPGLNYAGSASDANGAVYGSGGVHYRTDLSRFRWWDGATWHTFIGADTTDSLSNKTLILPSVNGVVISGTPSAGQGLVASSPTAASWANGSLSTTTDGAISGNVTVNNTATTIKAVSVTFPSSGCPCRALLSYSLYLDFTGITNQANIDFWVDDGSGHQMAGVQTGQSNATTGAKTSASYGGFSSVTYNNSASITFTLKGIQSGAGGATVQAAPGSGSGPNSDFQVTVMPSVN